MGERVECYCRVVVAVVVVVVAIIVVRIRHHCTAQFSIYHNAVILQRVPVYAECCVSI